MKSKFTTSNYLFLGLILAAGSSLYGMESKRRVAEQVENKTQTQETAVTVFSAQSQEDKLRAEMGVGAAGWNSALLAQFYKDVDQLPAPIQRIVKEYVLNVAKAEGPLTDALFGAVEKLALLPVENLSSAKEVERQRIMRKYAEDVSAIFTSNKDAARKLLFAMSSDFISCVFDLILNRLPQLRRLHRALPLGVGKGIEGMLEGDEVAHAKFLATCVGSCALQVNLDSDDGIQVQTSTGIFIPVAQVIGAAHVSPKIASDMLTAVGFNSRDHFVVVGAVRELEQKLKAWLKEQKLAGTVLMELMFDKKNWQVTLKQKALVDKYSHALDWKTVWSFTWSENFNFTFYNDTTQTTAYLSCGQALAGDFLSLSDATHAHEKLYVAPLSKVALLHLIIQRTEEYFPLLAELFKKYAAEENKQEVEAPYDIDAARARGIEQSKRLSERVQRESPLIDDMVDYWLQIFINLPVPEKTALLKDATWLQRFFAEKTESKKS